MDRRNRSLVRPPRSTVFVRLPSELRFLIECYQSDRRIIAFSDTIRELLETHPEIDKRAQDLYHVLDGTGPSQGT
jgi:hypothetical protein